MNMDVKRILEDRKRELVRKQNENDLLSRQIRDSEDSILVLADSLRTGREALSFLEELANSRRGAMKGRIESVVTEAMKLIYGESYRVELEYTFKNNRSHLAIMMVRDTPNGEVRRDMSGFGGGVADTLSVPLRLMVLIGSKKTDKVCILDECWKHMDLERIGVVGKFIRLLTDRLGIQVLFCTHHRELQEYAEKTYMVTEKDGCSEVIVYS